MAEPCTCPPPATFLGEGPDQDCPKHGDRLRTSCTPSTEHVRAVYAGQHGAILADEHGREFDRWLAEHDERKYGPFPLLPSARKQIDELLAIIARAPHDDACWLREDPHEGVLPENRTCTCWKRDVANSERST